ncbi:perlucin-like protein [Mercenaria mercenaria]|uniref:perlucin-like protein n=1 Tax=Mercenaria mercenaria TaxID=6596 RepID=UPI00234F62E2|nr:perlucin-like protein [Mercenaria mercenaria]
MIHTYGGQKTNKIRYAVYIEEQVNSIMPFLSTPLQILAFGLFVTYCEGSCPDGYCRHSGGCYLVVGLNVTWIDARSFCTVLGGQLLSVESSVTQKAVEGALQRSKGLVFPGKFWLDFNDLLNPKDWKRMRDLQSLAYENWNSNFGSYENETLVQNCVYMSEEQDYRWSPASCSEKINFICYASG